MGLFVIAVGFASLIFLSTIIIVAALMLRGRWDDVGKGR